MANCNHCSGHRAESAVSKITLIEIVNCFRGHKSLRCVKCLWLVESWSDHVWTSDWHGKPSWLLKFWLLKNGKVKNWIMIQDSSILEYLKNNSIRLKLNKSDIWIKMFLYFQTLINCCPGGVNSHTAISIPDHVSPEAQRLLQEVNEILLRICQSA